LDEAILDGPDDSSMKSRYKLSRSVPSLYWLALVLFCSVGASGCHGGRSAHSLDPRLRKVDEMLSANIHEGMTRAQVRGFLKSRGYQFEARPDVGNLRVVVRHVDAETLQPMTVRAIFHFDPNDRLINFELQRAPDVPFQP
jgi:hypothetical protein